MKRMLKQLSRSLGIQVKRRALPTIPMTIPWLTRFEYLSSRYREIESVRVDIVECGVGKGGTLAMLAYLMIKGGSEGRLLWGFDSFQGFPTPSPQDQSPRNPQKGDWNDTSENEVEALLLGSGISRDFLANRLRLVPGFFETTMSSFPQERSIAFLHVDVDLYQSYLDVLTALFPKVAHGGAILFDEYQEERWPGATRAIDEYLTTQGLNGVIQQDTRSGKFFLVKP